MTPTPGILPVRADAHVPAFARFTAYENAKGRSILLLRKVCPCAATSQRCRFRRMDLYVAGLLLGTFGGAR